MTTQAPAENYVRMEQKVCPICSTVHHNKAGVLIDKRLREIPEDKTITGWELCAEHEEMQEEYLAFVEAAPPPTSPSHPDALTLGQAERTGRYFHLRRSAYNNVFKGECPDRPFVFINEEAFDMIAIHTSAPDED
jgi:hypothetical protein